MVYVVGTVKVSINKQWKYSSSISKSGMLAFIGRSASFFTISTDCCVIHDSMSFG